MADKLYEITGQRQTTALGPDGRFQDVVEITATSVKTGTVVKIEVPLKQATPDEVAKRVRERIEAADAIADLTD